MGNYRDRLAWQAAHELAVEVYRISRRWSAEERYGLTAQLRRAAFSVPVNIEFAEATSLASRADREKPAPLADRAGRLLYRLMRRLPRPS